MMRVLCAFLALAVTVSAQGLTGPNFYITGNNGQIGYLFSINGASVEDPSLNLTVGTTYKFFVNATSLSGHPFGFSTNGDETATPVPIEDFSGSGRGSVTTSGACTPAPNTANAWYTTSGSEATNPCIISFTPPTNITGLSVYYRCSFHNKMVGTLTAVAAAGGSTTAPPSGTTAPPSGTTAPPSATTAPPSGTTAPPKNNGAALIVPGATAVIIAAINALFSA